MDDGDDPPVPQWPSLSPDFPPNFPGFNDEADWDPNLWKQVNEDPNLLKEVSEEEDPNLWEPNFGEYDINSGRGSPIPDLPNDFDWVWEDDHPEGGSVRNGILSTNEGRIGEEEDATRSIQKANENGDLTQTNQRELDISNAEGASPSKTLSISSQNDQDQKLLFCVDEDNQKESEFPTKEKENRVQTGVPKIKMKFPTRDTAFNFYRKYANEMGFTARKAKTTKTAKTDEQEKTIKTQIFVCSKEGKKNSRPGKSEPKYKRKATRTNCQARIKVALKDGEWEITLVKLEHNHELDHSQPRERNLSEAPNDKVGGFRMEEDDANAKDDRTQNNMDPKNSSHAAKMPTLQPEDVCDLKICFKHLQEQKKSFQYKFQDDTESQISNFLCWDNQSNADYDCFGDVLVLDTTFQEEGSGMICAPFWGIDHHQNCVLFGCGFLRDETVDSFVWLLKTFIEAIGSRQFPKTFYTDVSKAIDSAVEMVFKGTRHRLSTSYICRNAKKQLLKHFEEPEFEKQFNKCVFYCRTRPEFESELQTLQDKYDLYEHPWIDIDSALYNSWEKWSDWSCKDTFTAGIESLFNSESVGDVIFKGLMNKKTALDFVKGYIHMAEGMRSKDFKDCKRKKPEKARKGMERYSETVYTQKIFKKFKRKLLDSNSLAIEEGQSSDNTSIFILKEENQQKNEVVKFERLGTKISCSCKKFESTGILCRHSLKVLIAKNIFQIPPRYVLKRWTKSAKNMKVVGNYGGEASIKTESASTEVSEPPTENIGQQNTEGVHQVNSCRSSKANNQGPSTNGDIHRKRQKIVSSSSSLNQVEASKRIQQSSEPHNCQNKGKLAQQTT